MSADIHCHASRRATTGRRRGGLTTLEFAGCVTAVLGGAWIGAMYLGVNLEHLAHSALVQAQLLEKVPAEWRPKAPNVVTREQLVSTLRKELGSLRSEILALRSGTDAAGGLEVTSDAAQAARDNTRAYWLRLNDIALSENDLQSDAETTLNETNAAKVFAIKARVSRFAAKGVEAVPSEGVDTEVVKFGRQLALWYGRADELYERAAHIWEMPQGQQSRAQLTDAWKRDELQHRQEARLLRERAAVLRASVSRQLGEEFPEFAKPLPPPALPEQPAQPAEASAKTT
jgi:hypothetical protein